jgi:Fe-S-cluster containining protein
MVLEYNTIFNILDELKIEEEKTIETIRKNLFRTRPMILSRDQLEDYIKRIEFANEIMLNLEYLVKKTFDTYINFINIYLETTENSEIIEQQKILSERYDMTMTEWQSILSKIERFNDLVKDFM